ncbi:phage tail protein I [Roseibium litorale]|uniref:Phage tail protein I n=1 Tax=Roseibium litorale TaxID=2803841 RepID=A0ABR9CJ99_9HYPH|nr:phage tail protein I [Roseibium litorale]MBD8890896.1 phage tail protein I [Roseibium litorale]
MTDLSNHAGLLPSYATDLERRVASVGYSVEIEGRFGPLSKVTLPLDAPEAELPFLAWEESVDYWRDEWPAEIKRQVIDAAETVHIFKGTLFAVETALKALSITAQITEWFEALPEREPGTFHVTAYANSAVFEDGPILDARLQADAIAWVNAAKPLTRQFSFELGALSSSDLGLAEGARATGFQRLDGKALIPNTGNAVGSGVSGRQIALCSGSASADLPSLGCAAGISLAGRSTQMLRVTGDLIR